MRRKTAKLPNMPGQFSHHDFSERNNNQGGRKNGSRRLNAAGCAQIAGGRRRALASADC
jgi:hypothetical protein